MKVQRQEMGRAGILLAGDPGTGKTSAIKFFAELTGLQLITIEAPHITEEHIINIPFIVFNPATKSETKGEQELSSSDYKIVLSDSNLFSQISKTKKIADAAYLKSIYSGPDDMIKIFEALGGDSKTIPDDIVKLRAHYSVVLFLDEYFRQTSMRIRNMLRGILNGKIGSHDIPKEAYVIYASNLATSGSEGVEDIPLNSDFLTLDFKSPNKDDWFAWLVAKYKKDEKVKLNEKVIEEFYTLLTEEDLNDTDIDAEVHTSPRRWEQLLLYINSSLPAKDEADARALMSNVKINFKNYQSGQHAELAKKVMHAVAKLVKETSNFEVSEHNTLDTSEWRTTLEHQLRQKMKLGHHRKYVPIISGAPGIGKTSQAQQVAADLNLRYIYIDCSTLDAEDTAGMPLAKNKKDGSIETTFSEAKLYRQITEDAKKQDAEYIAQLKEKGDADSLKKAKDYKNEEWKYLIFFDELNRTSTKVFNGIRRVLLEKTFGDNMPLPDGSIVMSAINPSDVGTTELTQHMQDVIDVIDAHASWKATKSFIDGIKFNDISSESSKDIVFDALLKFIDKFKTPSKDVKGDQKHFYLNVGSTPVYVSPREYAALFANAVENFDMKSKRILKNKDLSKVDPKELKAIEEKLKTVIFDSFKASIDTVFLKHNVQSPEFMDDLKHWMVNGTDIDLGEGVFYKKAKTANFKDIVQPYFDDASSDLTGEIEFINFINNSDPHKFKEALTEFLMTTVEKDDAIIKNIIDKKSFKKTLNDDKIDIVEKEMVSKLEHFIRSVIHSLDVHKLSNDKREMVMDSVSGFLRELQRLNTGLEGELLEFNGTIYKFIKGITK